MFTMLFCKQCCTFGAGRNSQNKLLSQSCPQAGGVCKQKKPMLLSFLLVEKGTTPTNHKIICRGVIVLAGVSVAQGMGQVLVNIMTAHRCQCFLCLWFMSSSHSANNPFICYDGTSFKAELHQRACNCCGMLSDVSVSPLHAFYSTTAAAAKSKERLKDFWRFNITANIMVNLSCTQWKQCNALLLFV